MSTRQTRGLRFERHFTPPGQPRLRPGRVGAADRGHHRREGPGDLRAERRRGPPRLVAAGDQRRRPEVLPRPRRHPRAGDQRPPARGPRGGHAGDAGAARAATSPPRRTPQNWAEELRWLLVTQHASFNSPVWFNIGVPGRSQQGSACFINSVQDSMESILELAKTEGMLFKFGSGTGTNLSVLRSSKEQLSGGGTASGPVSFMTRVRLFAGSIKSGGTTRRAAKMVILNADHPDVARVHQLQGGGGEEGLGADRCGLQRRLQRARRGVRLGPVPERQPLGPRERRVHARGRAGRQKWETKAVIDGRAIETHKARDMWQTIADAAWICGDPGCSSTPPSRTGTCVPEHRPDQRHQPLLRVRLPRRHRLQPARRSTCMKFQTEDGRVRCRAVPARRGRLLHRSGDPRLQRLLPHSRHRQELRGASPARSRLRQPGRPTDVDGPGLRLRRGPPLRRRDHRDHDRPRFRAVGAHGRGQGSVQRVREEPRADAAA